MEENSKNILPDWKSNELGNLIVERKKSPIKVSDADNYGDYPFFTSGDAILKHSKMLVDDENIFLATGGIANIKFFEGKASFSTDTYVVSAKDNVQTSYLYYYLLDKLYYINANYFQGSGLKHLQKKDLKKHTIHFPESKSEQRQIAEILTKVDNAIDQTEQLIAKYSRIKTGLMQDLLTKGIDEHGNIRSEETHEFKDSPLGRIPKEWKCETLNNCIELFNNKRKPISAIIRANKTGEYPYYGATGIIDSIDEYRLDGEFVLFGEDGDHFLKWVNMEQTILVNGKFNVSNHAHIVKSNDKCTNKWIHNFFSHRDITFYLTRQGAGRFKLNKKSLNSLPLLLPESILEQNRITDRIDKINSYSQTLKAHLYKLISLKTGLMQDLLSGKVRVTYIKNKN